VTDRVDPRTPTWAIRVITATSLFDGHDASINIMRRILQDTGVEVIHLGHNRSVSEIVRAAIDEDVQGMINHMVRRMDFSTAEYHQTGPARLFPLLSENSRRSVSGLISAIEAGSTEQPKDTSLRTPGRQPSPIVGITGTGGAGKSSLTDELVLRFLNDFEAARVAVLSCDPSKRKTGGALLGDRIRMNSLDSPRVYMRSMATRGAQSEVPDALPDALSLLRAFGFDLIVVETAGIGQGDSGIVDMVDLAVYVMTGDFGAASQLEKIDMLDYADIIAINKFEKQGSEDALRDVQKQVQRNRKAFDTPPSQMPVYGTIASSFNDEGVTALYHAVLSGLTDKAGPALKSRLPAVKGTASSARPAIIPPSRVRYLSGISETIRTYHRRTEEQAQVLRRRWHLVQASDAICRNPEDDDTTLLDRLGSEIRKAEAGLNEETTRLVADWDNIKAAYSADDLVYTVRDREIRVPLFVQTESGIRLPKVALPKIEDPGHLFKWLREENLPGRFPFTAGVFPVRREDEEPTATAFIPTHMTKR